MGRYLHKSSITAAAIAGALAFGTSTYAAPIYNTSFDELNSNDALSQQSAPDIWATNDPFVLSTGVGQIDAVIILAGYSKEPLPAPVGQPDAVSTDQWATLGGLLDPAFYAPGSLSISVWKPFSSTGLLTGEADANAIRLDVDFAITGSTEDRPQRDDFSWTFGDSTGNTLFRLALEPASEDPADGLALKWYDSTGVATLTPNSISYNSIYTLQVDVGMWNSENDAFTIRLTDGFDVTSTILENVLLPEGAAASLAQIGTRWDLTDTAPDVNDNPTLWGVNAVVFNDFSISTAAAPVPEPSSALLLGAGALLGFARRQRRS